VTSWKVFQATYEQERSTPERVMMIYAASQQSLK